MRHSDTIAAIATPLGVGGIGIVRVSGPRAKELLARIFLPLSPHFANFRPWTLHRGRVLDMTGQAVDDVLAVFMPGPRTFTGEDVAEIQCHGGQAIVRTVLETLLDLGARLADRGEFSRRALLNGRMDLTQAEAVAEMIAAPTREALRLSAAKLDGLLGQRIGELRQRLEHLRMQLCVAVDFPEEEVECLAPQDFVAVVHSVGEAVQHLLLGYARCRCWQEGASVVLAGAVNAGKSSLMNALLGRNRALVTDIPGTTRDFLEEFLDLRGLPVRLTDTAGLRETGDAVEALGVERSRERMDGADVILLVLDGSRGQHAAPELAEALGPRLADLVRAATDQDTVPEKLSVPPPQMLLVWNKVDVHAKPVLPHEWAALPCVSVSARGGEGLEGLAEAVREAVLRQSGGEPRSGDLVPNMRQAHILRQAAEELRSLAADIGAALPYDVCAVRLDSAATLLGEITGLDSTDEVLDRIFSTFCIGK